MAQSALTVDWNGGLYLAIIIHRNEGAQSALTIALHRGV
jgi:hypothetical protein